MALPKRTRNEQGPVTLATRVRDIVCFLVLGTAIWVILSDRYADVVLMWAFSVIAAILGYYLRGFGRGRESSA